MSDKEQDRKERARERQRAWQQANREKVREYGRASYARHAEERRARRREQRRENPEKYREAERRYERSQRYKVRTQSPEYRAHRAALVRKYRKAWTPEQWQARLERDRQLRFSFYARIARLKSSRGCCVCGERDPLVLDFHHRDRTEKLFSIARRMGRYWAALEAEIAKCDVICANCHRRHHQPKWYMWMREQEAKGVTFE